MDGRDVLRHRMATLDSLLDSDSAALSGGSDELRLRLQGGWQDERNLIERILKETSGPDVVGTIDLWRTRTKRFIASSGDEVDGWVDAQGYRWDARRVMTLLDELSRRVEAWQSQARSDTGASQDSGQTAASGSYGRPDPPQSGN